MENLKVYVQSIILVASILMFAEVLGQNKPNLALYKTSEQKLQAWSEYCDEISNVEDYKNLRKVAFEGLTMTPKQDNYNLSLFNFYIGVTYNYFTESDSALYYLELSEHYGREAKYSKRITEALKQLLVVCNNKGKTEKRKRVLNDLQQIIDTTTNAKSKASLQEAIADYYATNGQYEQALTYLLAGIKARESSLKKATNNDSINYGVKLINVAELYNSMGHPQKCVDYLRVSELFILDYKEGIAHLYKDFVDAFLILNQKDSAILYYDKMQTYLLKIQSDVSWSNIVTSDLAFAEYYLTNKNLIAAKKSLTHAASLAPKYSDPIVVAQIDYLQGKLALALKNYPLAITYLSKSESILLEGVPEVYNSHQKLFAEAYAANGNWEKAYKHLLTHALLNDSLRTEASKQNLADMEAKYQNGAKQEKIEGLSFENGLQKFQLEDANRQRIYFIIGLILLLGMIVSMIIIYLNKQKSRKVLEQKNIEMNLLNENLEKANITKAKLFSIISHDLRNPISQVYQFLDLQKTNAHLMSEVDRQAYNEQISTAAGVVLETMEDLLIWSKTQLQQFNVSIEEINVRENVQQVQDLLQSQLDRKHMSLQMNIAPDLLLKTDRNIILIILRNLIQNAITYSTEKSIIHIDAIKKNEEIIIHIIDDGVGMPERVRRIFNEPSMPIDSKTSGLGLTIVKEMIDLINARVEIIANEPKGTRIEICFPNL